LVHNRLMRLRRIAVWSILGLLVSTAAVAVWLWTADLGFAKPHIERWVSEKTGRELVIDGLLSVDLASQSTVIAEDVRFSNAEWADESQMLTVGRAEVRINFWSIFSGPFIIDLIDIDNVNLNLVARQDGDPNWALDLQSEESAQQTETDDNVLGVLIRQIDIDNVQAVLHSPHRDGPLKLDLEYFNQEYRSDDFLDIRSKATLNERRIIFEGEAGTWTALLNGRDIHYVAEAQIDTFELTSEGRLDDVRNLYRPSVTFSGRGPDIDHLSKMLNIGDEGEGDIDISGSLTPADDGSLVLSVAGNIGQTNIEASGAFSDLQDLNNVEFNLLASGPDLGRLTSLVGIKLSEKSPFRIDVDAERQGPLLLVQKIEVLFGEAELEATARLPKFPSLDDGRIKVSLAGPKIERFRYATGLPGAAKGAFSLDFEVDVLAGGAEVVNLDLRTALGKIQARGPLGEAPGFIGSELEVDININSLEQVSSAYGIRNLPDKPLLLSGKVTLLEEGIRTLMPLRAKTDAVDLSLDGLVVLQPGLLGTDVEFDLSGQNLSEMTALFDDIAGVPLEAFKLGGRLQIAKEGYRLSNSSGSIGSASLGADGLLVLEPGLSGSNINFSISGPSIEELISAAAGEKIAPGRFALSGEVKLHKEQIDLKNVALERNNGEIDLDLELGLPVSRRWANFNVRGAGGNIRSLVGETPVVTFDELPFSLDARGQLRGTVSSIEALRVTLGEASIDAHGDLELGETGRATSFRISSNIPSLARLGQFNGRRFREQSLSLDANLTGAQGVLSMDDFSVKMGDSDIRGNIRYQVGDVPRLDVDVFSDSIVFVELLEESASEQPTVSPIADGRLIPDIEIPFDVLQKLNATLDIDIGELRRDALFIKQVDLQVDLRDGVLDVRELGFQGRSGYLRSRAVVESKDGVGNASFDLMSEKLELGLAGLDSSLSAEFDVQVSLEASGNNVRTLLGGLNGFVYVDLRGGQSLQNSFLSAIYGDLLNEIFNAINPFYKSSPTTKFECIIAPILFDSGKVTTDPSLFIRTDKLGIVIKPKINLSTEKLDVAARTTPRKGIVISAGELFNPFIKVTGKLSRPYLAVDEQGVLISGGAAVATGGLSLVARGLWDRMSRSKDPCSTVAASAIELLGDRFPEFADLPGSTTEAATIN